MTDPSPEISACPNCGHNVELAFCPNCGQTTRNIRISVWILFKDFLGDYFTFDSKLFRTLKPLLRRPGFLTTEFMAGRRVTYVPPLRLYIFISIVFFVSLASIGGDEVEEINERVTRDQVKQKILENIEQEKDPFEDVDWGPLRNSNFVVTNEDFPDEFMFGLGKKLNEIIEKKQRRLNAMDPDAAEELLVRELLSAIPKIMFLIMPLFALYLKVLYFRRDPIYVDHLIFAFHFHAFTFLKYAVLIWLNKLFGNTWITVITVFSIILGGPLYLIISLWRVYQQGIIKTFLKFMALLFVYFVTLIAGLTMSLFLAILSM